MRPNYTANSRPSATPRTQNQFVDFILADPDLCRAVPCWAWTAEIAEAAAEPPHRLLVDAGRWSRCADRRHRRSSRFSAGKNSIPADRRGGSRYIAA
jgi:hypothetical protein